MSHSRKLNLSNVRYNSDSQLGTRIPRNKTELFPLITEKIRVVRVPKSLIPNSAYIDRKFSFTTKVFR